MRTEDIPQEKKQLQLMRLWRFPKDKIVRLDEKEKAHTFLITLFLLFQ